MAARSLCSRTVAFGYAFGPSSNFTNRHLALPSVSFRSRQSLPRLPLSGSRRIQQYHPGSNTIRKDEDIKARTVQIVNSDGSLGAPVYLRDALLSLDREQNVLMKVADPAFDRAAVCKVISKSEFTELQRPKVKSKSSKNPASASPKQIELGWAIDHHDLSHRLKQMESFLNKGKKVHLLLIKKKGKRTATVDEAKGLVETIQSRINEVGATQVKPMQGKLLHQVEVVVEKS